MLLKQISLAEYQVSLSFIFLNVQLSRGAMARSIKHVALNYINCIRIRSSSRIPAPLYVLVIDREEKQQQNMRPLLFNSRSFVGF